MCVCWGLGGVNQLRLRMLSRGGSVVSIISLGVGTL